MTLIKSKKSLLVISFGIFLSLFFVVHFSFARENTEENALRTMVQKELEKVRVVRKGEVVQKNIEKPKNEINKNKETLPSGVLADDSDMKNGNACFQIEKISLQAKNKLAEQSAKLSVQRMETMQKKEILAKTIDDKKESRRDAWDENFDERFSAIFKNAKTPEQQQAAQNFKNTVTQAIAERRAQIDKATEDFRAGMTASLEDQKTKIDGAVETYHDAVKAAVDAAQTKCNDKASTKIVRDNFHTALEVARKNFEANRTAIEKTKNTTQLLSQVHTAAIVKANADFKTKIEVAATILKTALKN